MNKINPNRSLSRFLTTTLCLVLFAHGAPIHAQATRAGWCDDENLGWNFYCQEPALDTVEKPEKKPETVQPTPAPLPSYRNLLPTTETADEKELRAIQGTLKRLQNIAVVNPTPHNIDQYLTFRYEIIERAGRFTDQARRLLWASPEINYLLKRPTGTLAKTTWIDERKQDIEARLSHLYETHWLVFLFRSDCPYCHKFSPVLRQFVDRYRLDTLAVSLDGRGLPGWPEAEPNRGQAERLGLADKPVPAVILIDKDTKTMQPVTFGLISQDELAQRVYALTTLEVGDDF